MRQTFLWFRDHDVELPANPIRGTQLVWKIPSQSLVADILRNPFYAGAYVWGRRPMEAVLVEGRLEKRQGAIRGGPSSVASSYPIITPATLTGRLTKTTNA